MMRNNKQGMVMVYVIIFLLVSQLIYWGLLRLNQINLSRYLNFNDYYTANIQEELVMNLLPPIEQMDAQNLEEAIMIRFNEQATAYKPKQVLNHIDSHKQFGVLQLAANQQYEQLYVYTQEVFLQEVALDYCDAFNAIVCSGVITRPGQVEGSNPELAALWKATEASLLDQGFRLSKVDDFLRTYDWTPEDIGPLQIQTNHGLTSYSRSNGIEMWSTELLPRSFSRQQQREQMRYNYSVRWRGYLFEREFTEGI